MKKNEQKSIQTLVDMIQAGSTQNELLDYLRSEEGFGFLQFDNNTQTVYDIKEITKDYIVKNFEID